MICPIFVSFWSIVLESLNFLTTCGVFAIFVKKNRKNVKNIRNKYMTHVFITLPILVVKGQIFYRRQKISNSNQYLNNVWRLVGILCVNLYSKSCKNNSFSYENEYIINCILFSLDKNILTQNCSLSSSWSSIQSTSLSSLELT